jgi:LPXTG-site transpeptidase (sortase) family protein
MIPRTRSRALFIVECLLLAIGAALAVYCAVILVEARRTRNLPIEPVRVTMTLPGDANTPPAASPSRTAPPAGTVIGRIELPSLNLSAPLLEGTDDKTLSRGAGHIEDTAFPGEIGNVGIAGHRDTDFRPLKRVKAGDEMVVTTADRVYRYRVDRTFIVDPKDVYVLDPTKEPTVTLVTCYPFQYIGHAPRRFIVQGTLVAEK